MSLLDCFAALAMTDAVVFADINAAQAIVNKPSSLRISVSYRN
jgi:hypothetical protein